MKHRKAGIKFALDSIENIIKLLVDSAKKWQWKSVLYVKYFYGKSYRVVSKWKKSVVFWKIKMCPIFIFILKSGLEKK